jgi:hypothetical protein
MVTFFETEYAGTAITFYSTGHSLGGGLAQHVLYDQPDQFLQAFPFDPSPVEALRDVPRTSRKKACTCVDDLPAHEARIYRIYESGEVLNYVRTFLREQKWLRRHIQEVAFDFNTGNPFTQHSMNVLASNLAALSRDAVPEEISWFDAECAGKFREAQRQGCRSSNWLFACPR